MQLSKLVDARLPRRSCGIIQSSGYVEGLHREYPEAQIAQYVIYCFGNQGDRVFVVYTQISMKTEVRVETSSGKGSPTIESTEPVLTPSRKSRNSTSHLDLSLIHGPAGKQVIPR